MSLGLAYEIEMQLLIASDLKFLNLNKLEIILIKNHL